MLRLRMLSFKVFAPLCPMRLIIAAMHARANHPVFKKTIELSA